MENDDSIFLAIDTQILLDVDSNSVETNSNVINKESRKDDNDNLNLYRTSQKRLSNDEFKVPSMTKKPKISRSCPSQIILKQKSDEKYLIKRTTTNSTIKSSMNSSDPVNVPSTEAFQSNSNLVKSASITSNSSSASSSTIDINSRFSSTPDTNFDDDDFLFSTQEFAKICEQYALSQTTDCVKEFESDATIEIKENPETCSKYVRDKAFADDTLTSKKVAFYIDRPAGDCLISQGNFFGLRDKVKDSILELKRIRNLYDWQEECLKLEAIAERRNLIYALPTSGGKTLVSEILMLREVMLRKKNVIFILPYVSIVQEKIQDLLPLASSYDFFVEEYCAGKGVIPPTKRLTKNSIYICTIEKAQILFDSLYEKNRLNEISLVVVDELHMIGDPSRGYNLEALLSKIIYLQKIPIQIVGMSATISNLNEVANFLNADIYTRNFRPIELVESVQFENELFSIAPDAHDEAETFKLKQTNIGDDCDEQIRHRDPDHIGVHVLQVIKKSTSCLIFCSSKKNCENVALLLTEVLPPELKEFQKNKKANLIAMIKSDSRAICSTLEKTIPFGIAYHHSGLTSDERRNIEEAFRSGILNVICCTSTLAAGVNLPASLVIIRSPYIGKDFLTLSRYKQMIGRAGRAGKAETGESIIMCAKRDREKLIKMLTSKMDQTVSAFINNDSIAKNVVLNLIATGICKSIVELCEFTNCLMASIQGSQYNKNMRDSFIDSLKQLLIQNAVVHAPKGNANAKIMIKCVAEKKEIIVYGDDTLTTSKLGKAAVAAGLSLEDAHKVVLDLRKVQINLVLMHNLQLLYLVAPKEAVQSISFVDWSTYNSIYMKLSKSLLHTASIIGITEKTAMKMIVNPNFNDKEKGKLKRFYVALILNELWSGRDIFKVADMFKVDRGLVNKLMQLAATQAHNIFKICEHYQEFWVLKDVLETFSKRLSHCCATELLPLMELPSVKLGRAKLMYDAGLRTICDVAKLSPEDLVRRIKNVNSRQASLIIKAARHAVREQIEIHRAHIYQMIEDSMRDKGEITMLEETYQ